MRRDKDHRRNDPRPIATPQPVRERVSLPGNTFRVAQAQRVLAADLPHVVMSRPARAERPREEKPCIGCATEAASTAAKRPAPAARRDDLTPARAQPMLHKPAPTCKGKPSERQSRSGGGAGRAYVPWCGGKK